MKGTESRISETNEGSVIRAGYGKPPLDPSEDAPQLASVSRLPAMNHQDPDVRFGTSASRTDWVGPEIMLLDVGQTWERLTIDLKTK